MVMTQFRMLDYYVGYFGRSILALEHLDTANQLYKLMGYICIGNTKELYWFVFAQDGNQNILLVAFAIVEGETANA